MTFPSSNNNQLMYMGHTGYPGSISWSKMTKCII